MDLLSVNDKNGLDRVYILVNSVKLTKKEETKVVYHLILEDVDEKVKQYFEPLNDETFKVDLIDIAPFKQKINLPKGKNQCKVNYYTIVRCLGPAYFANIDKMLYLDTDIVLLQNGIEQLFETDMTNYYMAGVEDIMINHFPKLHFEIQNTKTKTYINSGVTLFNYKLIRENGLDKQLEKWCLNWNHDQLDLNWIDQTLLNYLLRDKVKLLDYKFNDYSLVLTNLVFNDVKQVLKSKYNYTEPINSIKNAVILHFLGDGKPWRPINEQVAVKYFPYIGVAIRIWKHIESVLKRGE